MDPEGVATGILGTGFCFFFFSRSPLSLNK
jgi:hypothetical protein